MKKHEDFMKELVDVIAKASKDKKILTVFLSDILTPAEQKEIATRWQIVKRLEKGEPQRIIARDLKIGIATVTRGSRELSKPNGGLAVMIKKASKKR